MNPINHTLTIFQSDYNICLQCYHRWLKRSKNPQRCPHCKTSKLFSPRKPSDIFQLLEEDFILTRKTGVSKNLYHFEFLALKTKQSFYLTCSNFHWSLFQIGNVINYYNITNFFKLREHTLKKNKQLESTSFFLNIDLNIAEVKL